MIRKQNKYNCNIWQHNKYGGPVVSFSILALAEGGRYYSISGQTASGRPFKGMIRKDFFDGQLAAGAIVPASR